MRTLTSQELNRSVLARQLLLERSRLPLHRVVERMAGVQAQYIPSAYVGLWSRTKGFERNSLTRALERRSVVQATLMRGTIHLVSRADYWPIVAAIRELMREWWLRLDRGGRTPKDIAELADRVRVALADGPRKRKELISDLGIDSPLWSGVSHWVDMVRVPPSGTWHSRRADLYGLAMEWVGPDRADPVLGTVLLIRRYLGGFGPASRDDIRSFTQFDLATIDGALDRLDIQRFSDEAGNTLFDLRQGQILEGDTPAPVRFLGTWDASLLVHARRTQILPDEFRNHIFHTKAPHSFNTFLVDGQVRGTWRQERGEIQLDRFQPIPRRFQRELHDEAERLSALYR